MLICRSACTNCRFLELHLWCKTVPAVNYMQHTYMEGTQRLHDQGLVVLLHVSRWWHLPFIGWYIYLAQLVYLLEFVLLPLLANSRLDWLIRALLGKLKVVWRTSVWEHLTPARLQGFDLHAAVLPLGLRILHTEMVNSTCEPSSYVEVLAYNRHARSGWLMHCLADRSNQSVCSRWSQTLHGQPSPKTPESKLIISASHVLRAVAPWRLETQHKGQKGIRAL